MEAGKVVEIIGAVIDVQFSRNSMPKIFDALKVDESGLTLEVQQHLLGLFELRFTPRHLGVKF